MIFLLLPHQLFDSKYLDKKKKSFILWEHPKYFKDYNFNKKKNYSTEVLCNTTTSISLVKNLR